MAESRSGAVSFLTLEEGTPVVDRFGSATGAVDRVMLHEYGGFDGLVVETDEGRRFVDAPEVRRISGGAVTLGVTVDDVLQPARERQARLRTARGAPRPHARDGG